MPVTAAPRFLVKMPTARGRAFAATGLRLDRAQYTVSPLFPSSPRTEGLGITGPEQWFIVEAAEAIDPVNAWDAIHDARKSELQQASVIEPDLEHRWLYENPTPLMVRGADFASGDVCQFNDQNPRGGDTPVGPGYGWFLRDDFSQLKSARDVVRNRKPRVRIAHLDTGYDRDHVTVPAHLNAALARNFVDDGRPDNDATDPSVRGLLRNPGHGTGTLSILAGNRLKGVAHADWLEGDFLGGAPNADIIPLRIATSVVLFRTSAFARAVAYAIEQGCDVLSMSMGGVASAAWTDIVNAAYEQGLVLVTAAGNNFGGLPACSIVYPARYNRVIAACGVMANGKPYSGLPIAIMQGNSGPHRKMATALCAYTPNMPWAELGCSKIIDMDGQGTSSATPQIAAAAALWLMHHNPTYPEGWMKVEAVRKALFESADKTKGDSDQYGQGILRARSALNVEPPQAGQLAKTPTDSALFGFFRVLTGLGVAEQAADALMALEASQLMHSKSLEDILPDPDVPPESLRPEDRRRLFEAMMEEPNCSAVLRQALQEHLRRPQEAVKADLGAAGAWLSSDVKTVPPTNRRLRIYGFDPSLDLDLDAKVINQSTIHIPWEKDLRPGPVGEYIEVVDVDPPSGCAYSPVDINDPHLLAQDGHSPSEGNPQFHQQMTYAIAMKTIKNFEYALGRVALWSARRLDVAPDPKKPGTRQRRRQFVQRLRIYPHALRQANAFYSPEHKALLFGYFPASRKNPGRNLPGGTVFACLSHDIVAHETTHALLDGLHPRFTEASNADVLAFHEAFADIVALFQHFTFPEALLHQIQETRGNLDRQNLLGELAQQFGQAIGQYGALRDAIGQRDKTTGDWQPRDPKPEDYQDTHEPHARGSILVAAVFEAFLAIYKRRVADLIRIATGGTGILPAGDIHPDLAQRLAREAAGTAQDVLNICIRALDYCPPVDITFGEYLRALITADWDLSSSDDEGYRIAFIEAFRRRGIYPEGVRTLSEESLRWRPLDTEVERLDELIEKTDLTWDLYSSREGAFERARKNQAWFHWWIRHRDNYGPKLAALLGMDWDNPVYEVHSVRPARRTRYDSSMFTDLVVEITQRRPEPYKPGAPASGSFTFRGGCTLLIDLQRREVRYVIRKNFDPRSKGCQARVERQREFLSSPGGVSLYATYFGDPRRDQGNPFALLHQGFLKES